MNKIEAALDRWVAAEDIPFSDVRVKENYQARAKRIADSIVLRKPDRVPVCPSFGMFPALDNGATCQDVITDYQKASELWTKTHLTYEPDMGLPPLTAVPDKVFEMLRYTPLKMPGRDLPSTYTYQFEDREQVTADEFYSGYLNDPSDFMMRTFLPRICEALTPLKDLFPFSTMIGYANGLLPGLIRFGEEPVQKALRLLSEAGKETARFNQFISEYSRHLESKGYPIYNAAVCGAPFDLVSDWFRGTKGVMTDMYRYPEKLKAVMAKMVQVEINTAVTSAESAGTPFVSLMLHKGSSQFLTREQFKEFYWPSLREVLLGIIEAGRIPMPLFEGKYTSRLDVINDIPSGSAIYWFEDVDMNEAQKQLGGRVCFRGNIPGSLLHLGTPEQVTDAVKELIDLFGRNGGLIVDSGVMFDEAKRKNVRAMVETTKSYG